MLLTFSYYVQRAVAIRVEDSAIYCSLVQSALRTDTGEIVLRLINRVFICPPVGIKPPSNADALDV